MNPCRHARFSVEPTLKILAAGALALASSLCPAGDIYRWVDEQGHIHMADTVPQRYKAKATKIDPQQFEVPAGDRQAAAARVAQARERQAAQNARRARAEAAEPQASAPAAALPPAATAGTEPASECERLWQEYFKSQECFAPYLTVRGIKAEAFEHCQEVGSPDQQCGQAKKIGTD